MSPLPAPLPASPLALPSPSPPSGTTPACCCSIVTTAKTINHSIFHRTTRIPLYIHPSLWTSAHIDLLKVSITDIPPPVPKPTATDWDRRPQGSLSPSALDDFLTALEFHCSPFQEIIGLLSSIVTSFGHPVRAPFSIEFDQLLLHIGPIATTVTPNAFITRTNQRMAVPFLAYSDPDYRRLEQLRHARRRTLRSTNTTMGVNSCDVAVLIAMAQEQQRVLPLCLVYRVYLLSPNDAGTQLEVIEANVTASYLMCLHDLNRPLTGQLQLAGSVVRIEGDGGEFLDYVRAILDGAPKLPKLINKRKRISGGIARKQTKTH